MARAKNEQRPLGGDALRGDDTPHTSVLAMPSAPAEGESAAQLVIYDRADHITLAQHDAEMNEVLERLAAAEQRAEAESQRDIAAYDEEGARANEQRWAQVKAHAAPRQWCVREAAGDVGLETLLNRLAGDGWQVYTIFEPRGGAYRVVAWVERAEVKP